MGLLERLERSPLRAVTWSELDDRWYQKLEGTYPTAAGVPMSPDLALRVSAVFACNSLIAETLASMPCVLYRRTDDQGAKVKAREHRWYKALRRKPNVWQTPMNFLGDGQMNAGMKGQAIAEILDDGERGQLRPLNPDYVTVDQLENGRLRYLDRTPGHPEPRPISQDRILHVRDLSMTGIVGMARASLAREAIAISGAADLMVGSFFRHDATGRLVVDIPGAPDATKRAEYRAELASLYAGAGNARRTMLTWNGMKVTELGKSENAGFLVDPRNYQVADIARFWRVPLFMIGLEEKSTTWGTGVEQQKQGFVDFTIKPWLDRWAQALGLALLDEDEQEEYFFEFLMADLVRGDLLQRAQAYQIFKGIGVMSPNDILRKENESPRTDPGGDEYQDTVPGAAPNAGPGPAARPRDDEADDEGDDEPAALAVPGPIVADAVTRLVGVEVGALRRRAAKAVGGDLAKWVTWVGAYYEDHRVRVREVFAPLAAAYAWAPALVDEIAQRIERTAVTALGDGVPTAWLERRRAEVLQIVEETLTAGAAVRRRAA